MLSSSPRTSLVGRFVLLLPALAILVLVGLFSVDVPEDDDWETPGGIYVAMAEGGLGFDELFAFHNESRPAVPRLAYALLLKVFGWNTRVNLVLSWLACLASWLALLALLRRHLPPSRGRFWLALVVGLTLFSTAQWKNQLWAIQLFVFLPPALLTAALWLDETRGSVAGRVLGCAMLSLLATFSFANGMACWVLGFPAAALLGWGRPLAGARARTLWAAAYALLGALALAIYFGGPAVVTPAPEVHAAAILSAEGGTFLVTWLGAPLTFWFGGETSLAFAVGLGLLLVTAACALHVARRATTEEGRELLRACRPFACLLAYALLSGIATAVGRLHFGIEAAHAARYATTAGWFTVALLPILYLVQRDLRARGRRRAALASGGAVLLLAALVLAAWPAGIAKMKAHQLQSEQNLLTLRLVEQLPENPLLPELYRRPQLLIRRLESLGMRDWLDQDLVGGWLGDQLVKTWRGRRQCDGLATVERGEKNILHISGWAKLPDPERAADCVLIALEDEEGELELVSGLTMKRVSPGSGQGRGRKRGPRCKFGDSLPLSARTRHVHVFAADLEAQQLYLLPRSDS